MNKRQARIKALELVIESADSRLTRLSCGYCYEDVKKINAEFRKVREGLEKRLGRLGEGTMKCPSCGKYLVYLQKVVYFKFTYHIHVCRTLGCEMHGAMYREKDGEPVQVDPLEITSV